jgi:hypothetical protein
MPEAVVLGLGSSGFQGPANDNCFENIFSVSHSRPLRRKAGEV